VNGLRGVAAVLVAGSHLAADIWLDPSGTSGRLGLTAIEGPSPRMTGWLSDAVGDLSMAAVGFGLFFLVGGFVAPYALERRRAAIFLASGALRLLPTYAVGFVVGMAALAASALWRGAPFPFAPGHVALHAIPGTRALVPFEGIDGVVWSLEIAIGFSILCALMAGSIARGRLIVFLIPLALSGACLVHDAPLAASTAAAQWQTAETGMAALARSAPFMIFMFIGLAFALHQRGHLARPALAAVVAVLMGAFIGAATLTPSPLAIAAVKGYALALLVFAAAQRLPQGWATWPPARSFAAISFPLYGAHAVLGSVLTWHLAQAGLDPDLAVLAALLGVLGAAVVINRLVERPAAALARRLGRHTPDGTSSRKAQQPPP